MTIILIVLFSVIVMVTFSESFGKELEKGEHLVYKPKKVMIHLTFVYHYTVYIEYEDFRTS